MAKLKGFNSTLFNDTIQKRLLVDVTAPSGKLFRKHEEDLDRVTHALMTTAADKIRREAVESMISAIEQVRLGLQTGFSGAAAGDPSGLPEGVRVSWQELTPAYIKTKPAGTKDKYWKRSGKLAKAFSAFSRRYEAKLNSKGVTVTVINRQKKYRGKLYRYAIEFQIPSATSDFMNILLRESFAAEHEITAVGTSLGGSVLDTIGYLEGAPIKSMRRHRPWISQTMAHEGRKLRKSVNRLVTEVVKKQSGGRLRF